MDVDFKKEINTNTIRINNLTDILKKSIKRCKKEAQIALENELSILSQAITNVTDNKARIVLRKSNTNDDIYCAHVIGLGNEFEIIRVSISSSESGWPIILTTEHNVYDIYNQIHLMDCINKMCNNKGSELCVKLASQIRQ